MERVYIAQGKTGHTPGRAGGLATLWRLPSCLVMPSVQFPHANWRGKTWTVLARLFAVDHANDAQLRTGDSRLPVFIRALAAVPGLLLS